MHQFDLGGVLEGGGESVDQNEENEDEDVFIARSTGDLSTEMNQPTVVVVVGLGTRSDGVVVQLGQGVEEELIERIAAAVLPLPRTREKEVGHDAQEAETLRVIAVE